MYSQHPRVNLEGLGEEFKGDNWRLERGLDGLEEEFTGHPQVGN